VTAAAVAATLSPRMAPLKGVFMPNPTSHEDGKVIGYPTCPSECAMFE
jgi:hypothetical protein